MEYQREFFERDRIGVIVKVAKGGQKSAGGTAIDSGVRGPYNAWQGAQVLFHARRAWEPLSAERVLHRVSSFVSLCSDTVKLATRKLPRLTGQRSPTAMPSPNGDTRTQVVVAYQGHQVFVCAQCATVIVRGAVIRGDTRTECGLAIGQALQDELISKAFSGRDGRG